MTMMPLILPLGDRGLLIRFAEALDDMANRAAVGFAKRLIDDPPSGVLEIVPNLVSVHLRFDPTLVRFAELAGEVRLRLSEGDPDIALETAPVAIPTRYGGVDGPDLEEVAEASGLDVMAFVEKHAAALLRVLAIGFAPGFAYCGFHSELPPLPRRQSVRKKVPAGTILYAAGQTALTATAIPTGWHVIGRTEFRNFDPDRASPLSLAAGTNVRFEAE